MAGLKGITINTDPGSEPHIYAEDDAAIFQAICGQDGVLSIGQSCKATVLSNNKLRIEDGVLLVGGHFARIPFGEYEECEIENGKSGKNRNDIIVAKFTTTGSGGIDTMTCEVKKGVEGTTASDPEVTQESVYEGGKIREFPLYRVRIEGLNIVAVEPLFDVLMNMSELQRKTKKLIATNTGTNVVAIPEEYKNRDLVIVATVKLTTAFTTNFEFFIPAGKNGYYNNGYYYSSDYYGCICVSKFGKEVLLVPSWTKFIEKGNTMSLSNAVIEVYA